MALDIDSSNGTIQPAKLSAEEVSLYPSHKNLARIPVSWVTSCEPLEDVAYTYVSWVCLEETTNFCGEDSKQEINNAEHQHAN